MYNPLQGDYDVEGGYGKRRRGLEPSFEFAERAVRQGFVRKVFGLLAVQLAITVAVTATFLFSPPVKGYVASNPWTLWTAMGLSFVLVLVMSFWEDARRRHPWNLLMLFAFTACESLLVGSVSIVYDTQTVLLAAGITCGVVAGLALFTMQTKLDLTASGGMLLSLLFTLVFASILQAFIRVSWLEFVISIGGALLFSMYLVFDIQMLMGGGAVALAPDEYVYGALALYLDIINLFLYILRILAEISGNSDR